jgi:hypothetical protein
MPAGPCRFVPVDFRGIDGRMLRVSAPKTSRRRVPALFWLAGLLLAGCSGTASRPASAPTASLASPAGPDAAAGGTSGGQAGLGRGPTPAAAKSSSGGCAVFPADNVWHAEVSRLPVHRSSAAFVASVGADRYMHPDFGSGLWEGAPMGIPVTVVPAGQARVAVSFEYAGESDRGPYPIPGNAKIEGGSRATGDRHVILWDRAGCRAYELFSADPKGDGGWGAGSGAIFDLRSNTLRHAGWTSADASGLSVLAGLVRYDEVAAGRIDHAIRITVPRTRTGYTWPATHSASSATDPALPQMGQRFRLKAGVDTAKLPRQARIIAEAMQRYGVIVTDHGSPWYISGEPDDRWDNDALRALKSLRGGDFEAVEVSGLMGSAGSGSVAPS